MGTKLNPLKASSLLFVLFTLDILKPLGYYLSLEWIFLGIILLAFCLPLTLGLSLSFFFGYLKDILSSHNFYISIFEFPFLVFFIYYLDQRFKIKGAHIVILLLVFCLHLFFNLNILDISFPFLFFSRFLLHSFIFYYILEYTLKLWV